MGGEGRGGEGRGGGRGGEGKGKGEREGREAGELAPQTQKPNSAYARGGFGGFEPPPPTCLQDNS
jgi:hypothetical protein